MKMTLITTFAFAMMVFALNTNPVMAGALSNLWSSNQQQVDELEGLDEDATTKTAWGGWQAVLEACKGENGGWNTDACPYLGKEDVEKALAGMDDEKRDQYGDDWFNSENDGSEIAWVCGTMGGVPTCCDQNPDGSIVCVSPLGNETGNESQIAGYGSIEWSEFYAFCEEYPDMTLCLDEWWNEDAESRDGFGGRDIADSGDEGSTSAAGATEQ